MASEFVYSAFSKWSKWWARQLDWFSRNKWTGLELGTFDRVSSASSECKWGDILLSRTEQKWSCQDEAYLWRKNEEAGGGLQGTKAISKKFLPSLSNFWQKTIFFVRGVLLDMHQLETCGWVVFVMVATSSFPICMSCYSSAPAKQTYQFKSKDCYMIIPLCFTSHYVVTTSNGKIKIKKKNPPIFQNSRMINEEFFLILWPNGRIVPREC